MFEKDPLHVIILITQRAQKWSHDREGARRFETPRVDMAKRLIEKEFLGANSREAGGDIID